MPGLVTYEAFGALIPSCCKENRESPILISLDSYNYLELFLFLLIQNCVSYLFT